MKGEGKSIYAELMAILDTGAGVTLRTCFNGKTERNLCADGDFAGGFYYERNAEGSPKLMAEYFSPRPRFIILGGGHIALPMCELAKSIGFRITVYDDRPEFANKARFPEADTVICDAFENISRLNIGERDYVAIVTRGHRHDLCCLEAILHADMPFYLGMIGSRKKIKALRDTLINEGADKSRLDRLHSPIGLTIGAQTPYEIAVSIAAELIRERRLNGGEPLSSDCDLEVIEWLSENYGAPCAMATVANVKGSAPRAEGAKMIVLPHGKTIGSIGGGCAEAAIRLAALDIIGKEAYEAHTVDLTSSAELEGMVCGGVMEVIIEGLGGSI